MITLTCLWYSFWAGFVGSILGFMLYDYAHARWLSFVHTREMRRVAKAVSSHATHRYHFDQVTHRRYRDRRVP